MKKIVVFSLIGLAVMLSSCNFFMPLLGLTFGFGFPKYRSADESMAYLEKEFSYFPEYYAWIAEKENWNSLVHTEGMWPRAMFFAADGHEIKYDSSKLCMGTAARLAAHIGEPGHEEIVTTNANFSEYFDLLAFEPEMRFDPTELGSSYDYVVLLFWGEFVIKKANVTVTYVADSARLNPYSKVAVIPICMDASKTYFKSKKEYRKLFVSIEK